MCISSYNVEIEQIAAKFENEPILPLSSIYTGKNLATDAHTEGYSSCTVPYHTSSLCHIMLCLQSLRCVMLYCSVGWCVKYGAVHHSHQQWLVANGCN